jgi:5-formyltetrahydrofolate cyclo-ligase
MEKGEAIARRLLAFPRVQSAQRILLYHTFRSEVPTEPLLVGLSELGKDLYLPHAVSGTYALAPAAYAPGDPLEPGPYGVPQPVFLFALPPKELDLILAPGVAFDLAGGRMGYGKGYYDRFLSEPGLAAYVIGLGFEMQVEAQLPREPHDRRIDALATENRLRIFEQTGPSK